MKAKERLIVALDVAGAEEARRLVERLQGAAGMLKVGSQLFTAAGPEFVRELVGRGEKVFLDLKYHDIPHTVMHSVSAACRLGVSLLTVHALGGRAMLEAAVAALPAMGARLLAITVLTSHAEPELQTVGLGGGLEESVLRLARLAREAGVDGVVASAREAQLLRDAFGSELLIVTPAIRPAGARRTDQARSATPGAALAAGADYIVVGRPITEAPDPAAKAAAIVRELETAS